VKFLFIISHDDAFAPTETLLGDIHAWVRATSERGVRIHGNPLKPASEAVTVRMRKGKTKLTPGPFADTEEKMCAYELVECDGLDTATRLAAEHPMARVATIEVRPVWSELS
jgi:hypothetical protein